MSRRIRAATVPAGLLLTALALSGCSVIDTITGQVQRDDSGEVVEGNDNADVFAIEVGDCINDSSITEEVTSLPVVPCDEPHDSEVFHAFDLSTAELPVDTEIETAVAETCYPVFEQFVGAPYDTSLYYVGYYSPSVESWASGDREVLCTVYDDAGQTTGTLEGIGR